MSEEANGHSDDGAAAAFLAGRVPSSDKGGRDWATLLRNMGEAAITLKSIPRIYRDPKARRLLDRITGSRADMREINRLVDLLGIRVAEILAGSATTEGQGAPAPAPVKRSSRHLPMDRQGDGYGEEPSRNFIRL